MNEWREILASYCKKEKGKKCTTSWETLWGREVKRIFLNY